MIKRNTMYVTRDIDGLFLWTGDKPEWKGNGMDPVDYNWQSHDHMYFQLEDDAFSEAEVPMDSIRELQPILITE